MRAATSTFLMCLFLGIILKFVRTLGEGSGSDNEDGSGSGGSDGRFESVCTAPENANAKISEIETVRLIRCHVACIEEVSLAHPIWPSVSHQTLEEDCGAYQQVQECREGCANHLRRNCPSLCLKKCTGACNSLQSCDQEETSCQRQCDNAHCQVGCDIFNIVMNSTDNRNLPPEPRSAPALDPSENHRAWRYSIDPGNTSLGMVVDPSGLHLTSFMFRVHKTRMSGKHKEVFYWMETLESELNLEAFACMEDVVVQYYAINKNGLSVISQSAIIPKVHQEVDLSYPENPENNLITFNFSADNRTDYWKHAKIHLSWKRPRGSRFLDHYRIRLSSFGADLCGENEQTFLVDKIESIPAVGSEVRATANVIFVRVPPPTPDTVNFACGSVWNEFNGTFHFTISWTLPNSTYLINATKNFELQARFVIMGVAGVVEEPLDISTTVPINSEALIYNVTLGSVVYNSDPEAYYSIQKWKLMVIAAAASLGRSLEGNLMITNIDWYNGKWKAVPWSPLDQILLPAPRQCYHSALPFPPKPVTNVKLDRAITRYLSFDSLLNQLELMVGVSWAVPVGGNVKGYHVTLVELAAKEGESTGEVFALEKIEGPRQNYHKFIAFVPPDMPQGSCFYFQVRSVSEYDSFSNWSVPQCIDIATLALPKIGISNGTAPHSNDYGGVHLFAAVGAGTGLVVLASCICMALLLLYVLKKKRKYEETLPNFRKCLSSNSHMNDSASNSTKQNSLASPRKVRKDPPTLPAPSPAETDWELFPGQVMVETRMGQGTFGEVFKGVLLGGIGLYKSSRNHTPNHFAVQFLKGTATPTEEEAFISHIEQAKMVQKQQSRHLVDLIGCVTVTKPFLFVRELPENGDLLSYLTTHRTNMFEAQTEVNRSLEAEQKETRHSEFEMEVVIRGGAKTTGGDQDNQSVLKHHEVSVKELFTFAVQIASGLECLSSLGVVHGDMACRNIFLDGQRQVKITDFSLSTQKGKRQFGSRIYLGTGFGRRAMKWLSPEAITEGKCTLSSDVWAFGVTLWEIVTLGGYPYNGVCNKDVLQYLLQGNRLEVPDNCSPDMYAIMSQCWKENPLKRPTITVLRETLADTSARGNMVHLQVDAGSSCYKIHRIRDSMRSNCDHEPVREEKGGAMSEGEDEEEAMVDVGEAGSETGASAISYNTGNYVDLLPKIVEDVEEDQVSIDQATDEEGSISPPHTSSPSDEDFPLIPSSKPPGNSVSVNYLEADKGSCSPQTVISMESDEPGGSANKSGGSKRGEGEEEEEVVEDEGIDILSGSPLSSALEDSPDGSNVSLNVDSRSKPSCVC